MVSAPVGLVPVQHPFHRHRLDTIAGLRIVRLDELQQPGQN
jgi:hypothetical protein